jgi:hypothetical protein
MTMNRRTMLLTGGAFAGVTAVASATVVTFAWPHTRFARILARHLPGIRLSEKSIRDFTSAYWPILMRRYGSAGSWNRLVKHLADESLPGTMEATIRLEREIVTAFLTGSNFFQLKDPSMQTVEFTGLPVACGNPFRRT